MASSSSSTVEHSNFPIISDKSSKENSEAIDFISNLPEPLMCHILSFLTTKEAAATSVLSSKWIKLWTTVPVIDLQEAEITSACNPLLSITAPSKYITDEPFTRFSYVMNQVLLQRTAHHLKKLRLVSRYHRYNPAHFMAWLKYVVVGDVEEVDLALFLDNNIDLPITFFTCKTLVVMKLCGNINIMNVPSSIHLPSLKIADIRGVPFKDIFPINRILIGCPVLEDFSMYLMASVPDRSLKISNPTLLKLRVSCLFCTYDVIQLEIDTPSLKFLDIEATAILDYSLKNLHNVVEARLNMLVENGPEDRLFHIFKALHEIRYMSISLFTIQTFTKTFDLGLPEFSNLVRLVLTISYCDSKLLVKLLQKCPKLRDLVIQKETFYGDRRLWIDPKSVPNCISSHLVEFSFNGYSGSDNELGLVVYILKSGNLLKRVTIQTYYFLNYMKDGIRIQEQLSRVPRASSRCELVFE
ncbi:hypothetical protein RIF29_29298 [Crotalaria pallida]|uniref:FBD domain-containing protein n=1 Tax=Crotalaria pallida TaxID=3830 RepID=A0AAN9EL31_CROPI